MQAALAPEISVTMQFRPNRGIRSNVTDWVPREALEATGAPVNDGQDVNLPRGNLVDHTVLPLQDFADVGILVLGNHLPGPGKSGDLPRSRRNPVDHPLRVASGITSNVLVDRGQMPDRCVCPTNFHSGSPNCRRTSATSTIRPSAAS